MKTIEWIKNAVIYQIYPDSFAKSDKAKIDGIFEKWNTFESMSGFKGGNLKGAEEKLDYLKDLGVNVIYLNPIFTSCANHRYHTNDYFNVDPVLGGNEAFDSFLQAAHKRGIKIILDGVFNHTGRGFFQFNNILENGEASPFRKWFLINSYPVKAYNLAQGEKPNYHCWWGLAALPKLNFKNQEVCNFVLKVAEYWLKKGIDGWRLDVPHEINSQKFWRDFRKVCKKINPDCYITGEIWGDGSRWLKGDMFDAVMNYKLTASCISYFASDKISITQKYGGRNLKKICQKQFISEIEKLINLYDEKTTFNQMNMMSSHDTDRMMTAYGNDVNKVKQSVIFTMLFPGAVNVYYGEELGLEGAFNRGTRRTILWEEYVKNNKFLKFYKEIINIRNNYLAVKDGKFVFDKNICDGNVLAFERKNKNQKILCIMNCSDKNKSLEINFKKIIYSENAEIKDDKITLLSGAVIILEK